MAKHIQLRRLLAGPAVALVSTLVCLLALEGAARLSESLRVSRLRAQLRQSPGVRFHPLLGWEKVPGHVRRSERDGVSVLFRYNSHGLRGPERDYRRPTGTRRVLVLGDSFAEGFFVDEDGTVAAQLERLLTAAGRGPCEAINGGTAAYSTDQEYLFYREEGRRYGASVVLLMFYYNDLLYNTSPVSYTGAAKPVFELRADRLVLTNTPLTAPPAASLEERAARAQPQPPWRGSVALRLLANRTSGSNPRLHRFLARLGLVPSGTATPAEELTVFGVGERVPEMWRRTRALLAALRAAVESDGGRLVVLYVPVIFEVDEREWQLTRERYALGRRWDPAKVIDRLGGLCRALDIPLADPRDALRRATLAGQSPYYRSDLHWNAVGHRLAAEAALPLVERALAETRTEP